MDDEAWYYHYTWENLHEIEEDIRCAIDSDCIIPEGEFRGTLRVSLKYCEED